MKKGLLIEFASLAQSHEDVAFQKIFAATENISKSFEKIGCTLKIIREWYNSKERITSNIRLPIKFGYECRICCFVIRNGKTLKIPSNDGEADYYECSSCYTVSFVTKSLFRLKLILNSDFSETMNELTSFLDALQRDTG